jgi:hypothetical protein
MKEYSSLGLLGSLARRCLAVTRDLDRSNCPLDLDGSRSSRSYPIGSHRPGRRQSRRSSGASSARPGAARCTLDDLTWKRLQLSPASPFNVPWSPSNSNVGLAGAPPARVISYCRRKHKRFREAVKKGLNIDRVNWIDASY